MGALLSAAASGAGRPVVNGVQFPTQNNIFSSGNGNGVTTNVTGSVQAGANAQQQAQYQQQLEQLQKTPGYSEANPIVWRPSIYGGVYATNRSDIQGAIAFDQVAQYGYGVLDQNGYTVSLAEGKARFAEEEAKLQALLQPQPEAAGLRTVSSAPTNSSANKGVSTSVSAQFYTPQSNDAGLRNMSTSSADGVVSYSPQGSSQGIYIGNYVPDNRAALIQQYGVDSEIIEMQDLDRRMRENPNLQQALMPQYLDAQHRWEAKGQQYVAEAKALQEQYMKDTAAAIYAANPGPGSGGFGLPQQIAGSVLANQSQAILGVRNGNLMIPAGNALETVLAMGNISPDFARYLSSADWQAQFAYDPDLVYDPSTFGFGYNSMGIGGNNTNATAYGGDGSQAAYLDYLGELYGQNAANSAARYQQQMDNYKGQQFIGGGPSTVETGVQGRIVGSGGTGPIATPHYDNRDYPNPPAARQMTDWELFRERSIQMGNTDPGETPPPGWSLMNPVQNPNRLDPVDYQNEYGQIKNFEPLGLMQPAFGGPVSAEAPKPFGGSLSPDWTSYDLSTGELFAPGYAQNNQPTPSSSLDHWPTGPVEAGQIDAAINANAQKLKAIMDAWKGILY